MTRQARTIAGAILGRVPVSAAARLCRPLSADVPARPRLRRRHDRRSRSSAPLVLRYAIDDLTRGVTRAKLCRLRRRCCSAIGLVGGVFRFLMRRILIGASRHIEYDMRNDFFAHLQKLPLGYFQAHRTGDLMSRATNDLNAVRMMIGPSVMYSANTLLTFVVALAMMLSIDARLTLLVADPAAVRVDLGQVLRQRDSQAASSRFRRSSPTSARSCRRRCRASASCAPTGRRPPSSSGSGGQRRVSAAQPPADRAAGVLLPEHVVLPRPRRAARAVARQPRGDRRPHHGRPVRRVQRVPDDAELADDRVRLGDQHAAARHGVVEADARGARHRAGDRATFSRRARRARESCRDKRLCGLRELAAHRDRIRGEIEFRDLVVRATAARRSSITCPRGSTAGQTVALVGLTGSGKSTLISLLARLHEPPPGTVFVDGVDVRDIPLAVLRGAIGFVPQEPFLFSDTLADNVAFGLDARRAAAGGRRRQATARRGRESRRRRHERTSEIEAAAGGRAARQGRRRLSQGLRHDGRRARHHAVGRPEAAHRASRAPSSSIRAILILDDALSAVDTYTEEEILSRLRGVMRAADVDHRVAPDLDRPRRRSDPRPRREGRIVERGTHDELIRHERPLRRSCTGSSCSKRSWRPQLSAQ